MQQQGFWRKLLLLGVFVFFSQLSLLAGLSTSVIETFAYWGNRFLSASMGRAVVMLVWSCAPRCGVPGHAAGTGISRITLEPWQEILQWVWWVMVYLGSFSHSPMLFAALLGERLHVLPQRRGTGPEGSMWSHKWGNRSFPWASLGLAAPGTLTLVGWGWSTSPWAGRGGVTSSDRPLLCFPKH